MTARRGNGGSARWRSPCWRRCPRRRRPCPAPASAAARVGYVDMKRLLDNAPRSSPGARACSASSPARRRTQGRRRAPDRTAQETERDGALLGRTTPTGSNEIDALDRSVRRTREELRNELKTRSDQELDRSWQEINNAVVEYAREQGYDLIVPSPVVYANPRVDITDAVLERLRRAAGARTP